jgi:hypothetical protein
MYAMKTTLLIVAAALALAPMAGAGAASFTSDPIATMNERQKLGPDSHSVRIWNQTYTWRGPTPAFLRPYVPGRYYRRRR